MPEGDTVHRAAKRLREVLQGKRITMVRSFFAAIESAGLVGRSIDRIEAHGKHLFVHFDDRRALRVHLGMRGSWRVYPGKTAVRGSGPALRLLLETPESVVVCWNARAVELIAARTLASHPVVNRLGPDVLGADFDVAEALRRLRERDAQPIGEALLDQSALSGIGNVFKSELLFLCEINPFAPILQLEDQALERLITTARCQMRRSLAGGRRVTRLASDGPRVWVYKRGGQPCLRCGTTIVRRYQGEPARSTYFCPTCQRV